MVYEYKDFIFGYIKFFCFYDDFKGDLLEGCLCGYIDEKVLYSCMDSEYDLFVFKCFLVECFFIMGFFVCILGRKVKWRK